MSQGKESQSSEKHEVWDGRCERVGERLVLRCSPPTKVREL
jgi:hypothetical protein